MRPIGFSTGALAKGDFAKGIELQRGLEGVVAIELSALRDHELQPFVEAARELDLEGFDYVSVHAPSRLQSSREEQVFRLLQSLPEEWPIIAHPELLQTPPLWQSLGPRLCLENMDNRKTTGRTVDEMRELFALYPKARFCLDVGHARQIDPTMAVALGMLFEFGDRLCQVHVSDVGPRGEHMPVRRLASWAFARVAPRISLDCPLIIESVVELGQIERELRAVREAFLVQKRSPREPVPLQA